MRRYISTIYIIAAVALIVIFGLIGRVPLGLRWLLVMGVFVGLLALIGREVTGTEQAVALRGGRLDLRFTPGRLDGVLIDSRNKISLSRLQLVLWTVVVLSAWATFALHRVIPVVQGRLLASDTQVVAEVAGLLAGDNVVGEAETRRAAAMLEAITGATVVIPADEDATAAEAFSYAPLDIAFPQEVLLALGISIASLAGAGLIKTNQATNPEGRAQDVAASRLENAQRRAATMGNQVATLESDKEYMLESMPVSYTHLDVYKRQDPRRAQRLRLRHVARADHGRHLAAQRAGDLHGERAHPARRPGDEHPLPRPQLPGIARCV